MVCSVACSSHNQPTNVRMQMHDGMSSTPCLTILASGGGLYDTASSAVARLSVKSKGTGENIDWIEARNVDDEDPHPAHLTHCTTTQDNG